MFRHYPQNHRSRHATGHIWIQLWVRKKTTHALGSKNQTHTVSVFVAMEFPDKEFITILKQFGRIKTKNLCRLYYTEKGCTNIERGICVAEFTTLDRDLPRKIVTQGMLNILQIYRPAANMLSMRLD